jgi:hypothetical protein
MAQMQINVAFDLGTAAGQAEFRKLFGYLLTPEVENKLRAGSDDPAQAQAALAGRQAAAAKARAAKAAKRMVEEEGYPGSLVRAPEDGPPKDLSGPEPNGAGDQVEDMGLLDPSMSPAEAKEAGLTLMREIYAAGKMAGVKEVQKEFGVAKFPDIDVTRGHEFYQRVMKLAVETGLRK